MPSAASLEAWFTGLMWAVATGSTAAALINPGFEEVSADGTPAGWTVLHGLDAQGYGPPRYEQRFDAIRPVAGEGGYCSSRCLSFPASGSWLCPVFTHSDGDGRRSDGRALAKAAVRQTLELPAGRYRFAARLRTAGGDLYSAAFSLGVNPGPAAAFANDDSTGIHWTRHDLAMSRSFLGGVRDRGEWCRYETEPFELAAPGQVTVWIRFNYANQNQMKARWQADAAAIVAVPPDDAKSGPVSDHVPCRSPGQSFRWRETAGDAEPHLVEADGTHLVDAGRYRLFRRAREIPAGAEAVYRFPGFNLDGPRSLLIAAAGDVIVTAADDLASSAAQAAAFRFTARPDELPTTREWILPETVSGRVGTDVAVRPAGDGAVRLYELELGHPGRTHSRLQHVVADTFAVPWIIGSWDASSREFTGRSTMIDDPGRVRVEELNSGGRWEIRFEHVPTTGHHYYLVYGLLGGRGAFDVGAEGIVDWIAETRGEEIVDFDITDLIEPGANTMRIETSGEHDFAALVEVCPGMTSQQEPRLVFEGDELASLFTRVIDNTWFWLRELHYEPSGFIDASVPRGKWYSQYWPVDMGFALREWVRWGYHEESVATGVLMSGGGWHGHASNRSGGSDNTGGNITVLQLCEILRRSDGGLSPADDSAIWQRIQAHCDEVVESAAQSPFGLIRGTNWENAGNLSKGTCYALTTTLGAAATLRKAAALAGRRGESDRADRWGAAAAALRGAVIDKLVLKADHRCPSGFILPAGTWAYGLRTDGSIEDQPLAGYFWAGADPVDVEGFIAGDRELLAVYDRTLRAAMPLFKLKTTGTVSGYASSYDGPNVALVIAALCDRIDHMELLLEALARETDAARDVGSQYAELSRWAYGAPGDTEDTNLVCAAGFLWGLRSLAGIDDLLAEDRQLRLVPRIQWNWTRLAVNDWPVRFRRAGGSGPARSQPAWTRLSFDLRRDRMRADLHVRSTEAVSGLGVRLGPFAKHASAIRVAIDGREVLSRLEHSGDAAWTWIHLDSHSEGVRVTGDIQSE